MNIRWLDSAEEDLTDFVRLEGRIFGFDVALQVFDDIMSRVDELLEFPYLGTLESSYRYQNLDIRVLHERHSRIFYTMSDDEIIIVLFWDNRRDDKRIESAIKTAQ